MPPPPAGRSERKKNEKKKVFSCGLIFLLDVVTLSYKFLYLFRHDAEISTYVRNLDSNFFKSYVNAIKKIRALSGSKTSKSPLYEI